MNENHRKVGQADKPTPLDSPAEMAPGAGAKLVAIELSAAEPDAIGV